jgi:alpha/beta superfamily hydrolase
MAEVIYNGPAGRIEGRYHKASDLRGAPLALVLHPHPQYGGTMNNKVVYALYRCFVDMGFNTLRFNFRGVGLSQGTYDNGEGELSDAATSLDWLQSQHPESKECWIAGFSFGALIGMQLLMRRPELSGFVSVSPPADSDEFNFLAPCPVSGMIMQGDKDDVVDPGAVTKLATKLNKQKGITVDLRMMNGCDHFYTGQLPKFCQNVKEYVQSHSTYEEIKLAG